MRAVGKIELQDAAASFPTRACRDDLLVAIARGLVAELAVRTDYRARRRPVATRRSPPARPRHDAIALVALERELERDAVTGSGAVQIPARVDRQIETREVVDDAVLRIARRGLAVRIRPADRERVHADGVRVDQRSVRQRAGARRKMDTGGAPAVVRSGDGAAKYVVVIRKRRLNLHARGPAVND